MDTPRGDGFVIDHGPEVRYRMGHQDDSRWDGFVFYPGDILISTRSRNGTTWVQMICALLILQTPDLPAPLAELSPWMEWLSLDRDELLAGLASQKHRRFIKTHTPLDGLALDSRVTYIVVARHPLDMAVSLYHHYANLDVRRLNELAGQPEAGESEPLPPLREWLLSWITQDSDPYQQADSLPG